MASLHLHIETWTLICRKVKPDTKFTELELEEQQPIHQTWST